MLFRLPADRISPPGVEWLVAAVGLGLLLSGVFAAIQSLPHSDRAPITRGKIQEIGFFVALLAFAVGFNLTMFYVWYGFALCIGSLLTVIFLFLSYDRENSDTAIDDAGARPSSPRRALTLKRRRKRMVYAIAGLALFLIVFSAIWAGPFALRYLGNRGEVEITPESGWVSVIVHKDGDAVTDWFDVSTRPTIKLPPGTYKFPPGFGPGRTLDHWEVTTHGFFASQSLLQFTRDPWLEIARGERVTLRAIMRDAPLLAKAPNPPEEPGWVPLFNGKDLSGWDVDKSLWEVQKNETLVFKGPKEAPLRTKKNFTDFSLRFEYQWLNQLPKTPPPFLNVDLRAPDPKAELDPDKTHPFVQFLPRGKDVPDLSPQAPPGAIKQLSGGTVIVGITDFKGATIPSAAHFQDKDFRFNGWNEVEIRCLGETLEVICNGVSTAKMPIHKAFAGAIVLQPNDAGMIFRKIEIKELPPTLSHGQAIEGWGDIVDLQRDCKFANSTDGVTITVPGGHHNLNPAAPFANLGAPDCPIEWDHFLARRAALVNRGRSTDPGHDSWRMQPEDLPLTTH